MALARTSLRGFLTHAKYVLHSAGSSKSPVTFVVGNESADLDSICSAIVYSYIATISPQARKPPTFHIPLLNLPKADIALRTELLTLLPKANITKDHLITLDDLGDVDSLEKRFPPAETRWILVDHNALQGKLGQLYDKHVVGTIDHHEDEGRVPKDNEDEPRIITTCGSCSSLVINHFRHAWDSWFLYVSFSGAANGQGDNLIEDGAFATLWDAQVAQLALAAILIDTADLKDKHKTTQYDREAVEYLESKIKLSPKLGKDYRRSEFYDLISEAKRSLDSLSIRNILRKDYKQWTEGGLVLGTSSVVQPHSYLASKAQDEEQGDLVDQSKSFASDVGLDIMSVMTAFASDDGVFHREVSLLSRNDRARRVVEQFAKDASQQLGLQEETRKEDDEDGCFYILWNQSELAASRKQIAPLMRKAMASVGE
ncbi:DHH phosphoesterase [Myriangium duriaei CBS 260.36]|uniref:DHH phosphoesterase n=1 Tax=Myriangium duriaei CBS 260.36 TaxID=1168546 RepID=A0A9P4J6X4_9PEZI|nr:DHH phosphoesterase [Myriangium duriaei CBS 260.36]